MLETEIKAHEPLIAGVSTTAHQLLDAGHYASGQIRDQEANLSSRWSQLKEAAVERKKKLNAALDVQKVWLTLSYILSD